MAKTTEKERETWEKTRNIGQEILEGIEEIKAGRHSRQYTVESYRIIQAREKAGLSQAEFSALLGVSKRTLEQWEQGRRKPSGAAMTLIRVAELRPEVLREIGLETTAA